MTASEKLDLSSFLPEKVSVVNKLAETAAQIAFHNFEWRYVTLVFFNTTLASGIGLFVKSYGKSVIIERGESSLKSGETRQFIFFGTDLSNIVQMLRWMQKDGFDNTGKFVFICQSSKPQHCDESEAMEVFWDFKIINVVFIRIAPEKNKVIGFSSYFVHNEKCWSSRAVRLDSLDTCIKSTAKHCENMFPLKFINLQKCPIIVSTFQQKPYMMINNGKPKGVDGDLLIIIAEGLNASLEVMTPRRGDGWGIMGNDGHWVGSLGDIEHDFANFSMTYPAVTLLRYKHFQMSIPYNFITLIWVTNPTEPVPASMKLLHPFQVTTQVAVGVTFIFVIVLSFVTRSNTWNTLRRSLRITRPQSSIVFYSWLIFMGLPLQKFPKKRALLFVAILWIWYAFIVRLYYQAALIISLKSNQYSSNVATIEEVIKEKYPFGGGGAIKDFYKDYPMISDNFLIMNSSYIPKKMIEMSTGSKFALAINQELVNTFLLAHRGNLYKLPQNILISPTVLFFKKYSPLTDSVNRVLWRLIEAGFPDKLLRNYCEITKSSIRIEDDKEPLNLKHYTGCYVLLVIGWMLSGVVFVVEICIEKSKYKLQS